MGYRGTTSTALTFGENGDCHGYLVGEPHQGLRYMFMMMNEARIGVGYGLNTGVSSSSNCEISVRLAVSSSVSNASIKVLP